MNEKTTHSFEAITQAVRRLVKGEAGVVLMHLGEHASIFDILQKFDCKFGSIDEKETIMSEFYNAKQKEEEDVSTWSCRLEKILSQALINGKVKKTESDEMLHDMVYKGLRPELKDKAHYEKEKYKSFDDFRVVLRKIEREHIVDNPSLKTNTKNIYKKSTKT